MHLKTVTTRVRRGFHRLRSHPNHWLRRSIGILLMIGGLLWFLPVLGLWMLPLGLVLFLGDGPAYRRLRKRFVAWRRERRLKTEADGR